MPQPSNLPGMGARPASGSVSFRVWAPFASRVCVAGEFNGWSDSAHQLAPEGEGYWSGDVGGANAGQQYRYVLSNGGADKLWKNDPYALATSSSNGNSIVVDTAFSWNDGYGMPAWDELVFYELHAGTFNDASGGAPGTFDTIIPKLDYLRDRLGVNALIVLPSAEFMGGISLGYDPSFLFAIEHDYGGPAALQRFVRAAHEHGIAVILDVVYNHLGPGDLDLKCFDGWSDPAHPDGIYFYDLERIDTPWGGPRPDYGRGEVRQFLRDNALQWLEMFRLDGLRFDGTNYIRTIDNDWRQIPDGWSLLRWINDEIDARMPWKLTVAEDMQNNPWLTERTAAGGAGFDTQWHAAFVHAVRGVLAASRDEERNLDDIVGAIEATFNEDALHRMVYTESHDESGASSGKRRLAEDIWPGNADSWASKKRTTLGAALVMTVPAMPMLFQGQEFLCGGAFSEAQPLDWARSDAYPGLIDLHRDLVRLRRNWFDTTRGLRGPHVHVFHRNQAAKVVAFHRWYGGGPRDDVVVVLNFSAQSFPSYSLGFPREGGWRVRLNSDWNGYDSSFANCASSDTWASWGSNDPMPFGASIGLGAYSAVVLSQD
ncbi:alpha-amylase family glycosyl hydrolase [Paraburkholderia atlantica]|uniref:alpha-amylase family glycosyl hydrolase n=1 Tax=Paraburkholderia atlantica TaxID=2654982 RepID=UPI003D20D5AF